MQKEKIKSLYKFLLVSSQPLFKGLSNKEKALVANRSQVIEYNKGDIIHKEGQRKGFLNIIISGRVSLYHPSSKTSAKNEITVEILRKGDYFGIISLLTSKPHSLSAKVLNDARIIRIEYKSFRQILNRIPCLGIHFSKALSRRLKVKYKGVKSVFQSTIISVYCKRDEKYAYNYAVTLSKSIITESGKKAVVIKSPKNISSVLDKYAGSHHFIILSLPKDNNEKTKIFLKQSDICHIIREGVDGRRVVEKTPPDSKTIYATLPSEKKALYKTVRRISREITGVRVGLALGSGGAIGLAQVGILDVLEKEKIPIDIVAGTSIGALIGALWAFGYTAREIGKICAEVNTVFKTLALIDITFPRRGLIAGGNVRKFLTRHLKDKTFHDVKLPFRAVACDIRKRQEVIISSGKLVDAVMASIAVPGIFNPHITEDKRLLVDGGIINPIPISILSEEGVNRIIAVNSIPSPEDALDAGKAKDNILDIIVNSMYSMEYRIGKYASAQADVYIHPILKGTDWYEFYKAEELIRLGQKEARKMLPKIKKLVRRR